MEFEVSFEIDCEQNFVESSFVIVKTSKRRSVPSVKRLDIHLSKIKTTFRKASIKKRRLTLNIQPTLVNTSFTELSERELTTKQQDLHAKQSLFLKNKNIKKSTASVVNKRIERVNQPAENVKPIAEDSLEIKKTIEMLSQELNKPAAKRPLMGVSVMKRKLNNVDSIQVSDIQKPSLVPSQFLEIEQPNKTRQTRLSIGSTRPSMIKSKKIRSL